MVPADPDADACPPDRVQPLWVLAGDPRVIGWVGGVMLTRPISLTMKMRELNNGLVPGERSSEDKTDLAQDQFLANSARAWRANWRCKIPLDPLVGIRVQLEVLDWRSHKGFI